MIDQFSERKIISKKLHSILLKKIQPFYEENGRICKILFANNDIISSIAIKTPLNKIHLVGSLLF